MRMKMEVTDWRRIDDDDVNAIMADHFDQNPQYRLAQAGYKFSIDGDSSRYEYESIGIPTLCVLRNANNKEDFMTLDELDAMSMPGPPYPPELKNVRFAMVVFFALSRTDKSTGQVDIEYFRDDPLTLSAEEIIEPTSEYPDPWTADPPSDVINFFEVEEVGFQKIFLEDVDTWMPLMAYAWDELSRVKLTNLL